MQRAAAQRAADVDVAAERAKQPERRIVPLERVAGLAADHPDVPQGSQALGAAQIILQLVGQPCGPVRQALGLAQINPRDAHDLFIQTFDNGRIPESRLALQKRHHRTTAGLRPQPIDQIARDDGWRHGQNPMARNAF